MVYGTNIEQGDILLVRFPFTNFKEFKKRPVLVISGSIFNSKSRDLIVCAVTSNLRHRDFAVRVSQNDLSEGTLAKESIVKTSHIATISRSIVLKKIGRINENKFGQIIEQVHAVFM